MDDPSSSPPIAAGLKRLCGVLLVFDGLLGVAHVLWPHARWGQGRLSYLNFENNLTLASWLTSVQFVVVAVFAVIAFHRERRQRGSGAAPTTWVWLAASGTALVLSFAEMTRLHVRLHLLGLPAPDVYQQCVVLSSRVLCLAIFGWFLLGRLRAVPAFRPYGHAWLLAWGAGVCLSAWLAPTREGRFAVTALASGLTYLLGATLLLTAVGGYALRLGPREGPGGPPTQEAETRASVPRRLQPFLLAGVAGTTCTLILLQLLLFRMLTIFRDDLTANSVLSIALLGLAVGGLIGSAAAGTSPGHSMTGASLLLPVSIFLAFGASVALAETPLLALLLAVPFACGSVVLTVALVQAQSHVVYFADLLGAAIGALAVSPALALLREEGSFLVLAAFAFLLSLCFVGRYSSRRLRGGMALLLVTAATFWGTVGFHNPENEAFNVIRTKLVARYPQLHVLFSRSSLVGRYDVVRRGPRSTTLKTYENGRTIDTIRPDPVEAYQLDPRVPADLMSDPTILVLGLSGDGITKTARAAGREVHGVEINPAIVSLQTHELVPLNANSYHGINVSVTDARGYVARSSRQFDMIALMNVHFARGTAPRRAASPEYLHTAEAINSYLDHLTDRGVVIVEEPIRSLEQELAVRKLLATMRQVLVDRGGPRPEAHFFVFRWTTRQNDYRQILLKKTPFTAPEVGRLRKWLRDLDSLPVLEARAHRQLGPITCSTALLHAPDAVLPTVYSRVLRGQRGEDLFRQVDLRPVTDDRPFLFDVDPGRRELKRVYTRTLLAALLLVPLACLFFGPRRSELRSAAPPVLAVSLTGIAYLLLEVGLMQRCQLFLGSPVAAFSTVLGTLLVFSGLGSLWSGRLNGRAVCAAIAAAVGLLSLYLLLSPVLLRAGAALALPARVAVSAGALAPLAFFVGVPFPYVMRVGNVRPAQSAAALLFAINAAAGALAVPLALNVSTACGFNATFMVGGALYVAVALLIVALHRPALQVPASGAAAVVAALLLASPWLLSRAPAAPLSASTPARSADSAGYRVYVVSYGHSVRARTPSVRAENKVLQGGSGQKRVPFEWLFWVVRSSNRTILVDTGFDDAALAGKWGLTTYVRPEDRLRQLGLLPAEVDDVILTHAHWDHVGGLSRYPNARIWMQQREYEHLKAGLTPAHPERNGLRLEDLQALAAVQQQNRLELVHGETTPLPGITLTLAGGHTPGSQYVTVQTRSGPIILAGDLCTLYENTRRLAPVAGASDTQAEVEAMKQMRRRVGSPKFLLPGHDPLVLTSFPEVSEGIVEVTSTEPSRTR